MMDAYQRKVFNELKRSARIPRKIKAAHDDIEEVIVERGGEPGKINRAHA
jgi:hypothetical protein